MIEVIIQIHSKIIINTFGKEYSIDDFASLEFAKQ